MFNRIHQCRRLLASERIRLGGKMKTLVTLWKTGRPGDYHSGGETRRQSGYLTVDDL
jgi:hypothetical protein